MDLLRLPLLCVDLFCWVLTAVALYRQCQRAERKKTRSKHPVVSRSFRQAYNIMQRPLRNFFGLQHCEALVALVDDGGLALIIDEVLSHAIDTVRCRATSRACLPACLPACLHACRPRRLPCVL